MLKPKKNEIRKPSKTISGITPIAVMLSPRKCNHGNCVYCPSLNVPQSYTPKSPAVMRAMNLDYDSFEQVKVRLRSYEAMHHPTDKIEIIIMGGTFLEHPKNYCIDFIKKIFDALNNKKSKTLEQAQKLNETAKHRCVALCIETRPDVCSDENIKFLREIGCTRVELGVEIIDDDIYKKINRGHKIKDVIDATKRLKNSGFKVGYHIMPGLPESNPAKDFELFKKIFEDENFKPDQLKIYPCQVMPGSELEKWYWEKRFEPYSKEQIQELLIRMLKEVPRYCRVMRVMREIPPEYIVAGTTKIDLRKDIEELLRKENAKLNEIRYREIGFALRDKGINKINPYTLFKKTEYNASDGKEFFLEIINPDDILFGLLRLRIYNPSSNSTTTLNKLIKNSKKLINDAFAQKITNNIKNNKLADKNNSVAIIRELHVYGQALKIEEKYKKSLKKKNSLVAQHRGFGKWLIEEAEKIAKKNKCKEISIISGVGVRDYYKKLGYKLGKKDEGSYMIKRV